MNGRNTREKSIVFVQDNCLVICSWLGSIRSVSVRNFPRDLKNATMDSPRERFAGATECVVGSRRWSGRHVWR